MKAHDSSSQLILLEGPAGSGKTNFCLEDLEQEVKKRKDPFQNNLLFILPTLEHRERVVDVLLRRTELGFFNRLVSTFDDVLQSFLKLGSVQFASDVSRYLILKELIASSQFDYFKEAASTKGFVGLIANLVTELKEALMQPEELKKRFENLEKAKPVSKSKYSELFSLFTSYENKLTSANLKDRHDALFLFEEGLKCGQWNVPRYKKIWIDGFFDFSNLQLAFIRFLAAHANEIVITLTTDSKRGTLFEIPEETKKALLEIGFKSKVMPSANQRTKEAALIHLEQNLFGERKSEFKPSSVIQIFEATGLAGELSMIAREIKKTVREEKVNFSDIALIFRHIGAYTGVIQSTFRKFGIPVEIHEREELRLSPLARTIMSLFRIFVDGWKRDDLFNFLKSSFTICDYKKVCAAEIEATKRGIFRGEENWKPIFDIPQIKTLSEFQVEFSAIQKASDFIKFTKKILNTFQINRLSDNLDEETRRHYSALKRIYILLDEMEIKYGNASLKPEQYAEIFLQLIDVDLYSFHHRDKNKVQVYNISLARQKEYKVVFLPGLLEKGFPIQIKEDPVLSDEERRIFNGKEVVLKEKLPRQAVERFLFYMAVTRAREKLILSYPRFDLEGKEALPSFYVNEASALFQGGIQVTKQPISEVLPALENVSNETEAFGRVIEFLWQSRSDEKSLETVYSALYNSFLKKPAFKNTMSRLNEPLEGVITDKRIIPQIRPEIYTPTKLEEYAECAYRYFADQVLRLQSFEDKIDTRIVGSIFHKVLERFHIWAKEKKHKVSIEEAKEVCDQFLDEELKKNPLLGDRWYKIELKKREIKETIDQILIQELVKAKPPIAGLKPEHFELRFGFKDGAPALVVQTEYGPLEFRGQIDRIDVDPSGKYGLVIDYKLGKPFKKKSLENGTGLQLPLYILAMKQNLGLEPIGAHLYRMSTVTSSGFHHGPNLEKADVTTRSRTKLSDEEWSALFERIRIYIGNFTAALERGEIAVRPRDCVDFCAFGSVCRIEKWKVTDIYEEIKAEDKKKFEKSEQHERV